MLRSPASLSFTQGWTVVPYVKVAAVLSLSDVQGRRPLPPPVLQEATHFKKVRGENGQVMYEPCSPGDANAEPYTLQQLADEGKANMVRGEGVWAMGQAQMRWRSERTWVAVCQCGSQCSVSVTWEGWPSQLESAHLLPVADSGQGRKSSARCCSQCLPLQALLPVSSSLPSPLTCPCVRLFCLPGAPPQDQLPRL